MKPGAAVIAAVSGYEFLSIVAGKTPTITAIAKGYPRPWRNAAIATFTVWLYIHLKDDV